MLTYADEKCRVRAVTLRDLERHPAPTGRACEFTYSAGSVFSLDTWVSDPSAFMKARCRAGIVETAWPTGELLARARACAPAWKPNGALTAVRGGDIVELVFFPERPALVPRVVLSNEDLEREFQRLDDLFGLRVSPRGSYVAAVSDRGVVLLERDGTSHDVSPTATARAIAWSRDERWTAVATTNGIYFGRPTGELPWLNLALEARDLVWR